MDIRTWIINNLSNDGIIVEAGTSNGSDTLFFSDHFKNGKVYGFEPVESCYLETLSKVGGRINIEIANVALSDKKGTSTFYLSDQFGADSGSSSLLKPKDHLRVHPDITFEKQIEVSTINLDEWFESKNIDYIDLMWLDIQGAEPFVLKTSPVALSRTKYLYTEVSLMETYEGVIQYQDFKSFLQEAGFVVVTEDLPWVDMGNVLFRNTRLA